MSAEVMELGLRWIAAKTAKTAHLSDPPWNEEHDFAYFECGCVISAYPEAADRCEEWNRLSRLAEEAEARLAEWFVEEGK